MEDRSVATRTELAVLGLLAWSGESSGYELHKLAGRSVGFIWAPARSQLYAVLKRLAKAGLVHGRHVVQADRPDKRLFSISDAGTAMLREWLDRVEPIEPEDRDGVLLKLFFGAFGDPDAGRRQLLDYRERVERRVDTYREIERTFDGERSAAALRRLQSLRLGMALMEASLGWVDETLAATATPAPPHQTVRCKASDGRAVSAEYTPAGANAPAVVLLHEIRGGVEQWDGLVPQLHAAGFATLAYVSRPAIMERERIRDLLGAVRWLRARDDVDRRRLALVGASI